MESRMNTCPYCGSEDSEPEIRDQPGVYHPENTRTFYRCLQCRTLYPKPRIGFDDLMEAGVRAGNGPDPGLIWSHPNPRMIGARDLGRFSLLQFVLGIMRRYKKDREILRGLDVGANTGRFCYFMELIGIDMYGLEPNHAAVKVARDHDLRVFQGYFPDTIPDELTRTPFQLIVMNEVLYYFTDIRNALGTARKMLSDKGILYVKIKNGEGWSYHPDINYFQWYGDAIQAISTVPSVTRWLEGSGFRILEMIPYPEDYAIPVLGNLLPQRFHGIFNAIYCRLAPRSEYWRKKAKNIIIIAEKSNS